jgi:hypothetical protein
VSEGEAILAGVGACVLSIVAYLVVRYRRFLAEHEVVRLERASRFIGPGLTRVLVGQRAPRAENYLGGLLALAVLFSLVAVALWATFISEMVHPVRSAPADGRSLHPHGAERAVALVSTFGACLVLWLMAGLTVMRRESVVRLVAIVVSRSQATQAESTNGENSDAAPRLQARLRHLPWVIVAGQVLLGSVLLAAGIRYFL